MPALSRDVLLAAKPPTEVVQVPELDGYVIVRGMTGLERDAFELSLVTGEGRKRTVNMQNLRARLVACSCVDDAGERVFTEADAEALGQTRADVLDRLFTIAKRLSKVLLSDAEEDELGKPLPQKTGASSSSRSRVN